MSQSVVVPCVDFLILIERHRVKSNVFMFLKWFTVRCVNFVVRVYTLCWCCRQYMLCVCTSVGLVHACTASSLSALKYLLVNKSVYFVVILNIPIV